MSEWKTKGRAWITHTLEGESIAPHEVTIVSLEEAEAAVERACQRGAVAVVHEREKWAGGPEYVREDVCAERLTEERERVREVVRKVNETAGGMWVTWACDEILRRIGEETPLTNELPLVP